MVVVAFVEIVARVHGPHHSLVELQGQYSGILYLNRLASDIAGESADLPDAVTRNELNEIEPVNPQPDQEAASRLSFGRKPGLLILRSLRRV